MAERAEEQLSVRQLLADLDSFVVDGRRHEILGAFADALQPLYDLVLSSGGAHRGDGHHAFALFHLAGRSITDLIGAGHLASHSYVQQAYTLLRPVGESCDLMELFAQEPAEASRWIESRRPGIDFRPKAVRERIGEPEAATEMYGHLSEMGPHPRFAGSRVAGVMQQRVDDPSARRVVFRLGSFFEWHPATMHVFVFAFDAVVRLGFKLRHLQHVSPALSHTEWVTAFGATTRAAAHGCKLLRLELVDLGAGEGSEFLDTCFDEFVRATEPGGALSVSD